MDDVSASRAMTIEPRLARSLVRVAVVAGFAAGVMYPVRTFVRLPDVAATALFIYFGPV